MNLLSDIITYVRRIIKSPSDAVITDNLIIDYINRFWTIDVDARMQLFDLKTVYTFQTVPGVDQYNMPLYNVQVEGSNPSTGISFYPVYQGFLPTARIAGVNVGFYTQRGEFFKYWDNYIQPYEVVGIGNGGPNYTVQIPFAPSIQQAVNQIPSGILRGHVDITGIIATSNNIDPPTGDNLNLSIPSTSIYPAVYFTTVDAAGVSRVIQDSGQFLDGNVNYGMLMAPGTAPFGYQELDGSQQASGQVYTTTLNTINYNTGIANITFTDSSTGNPISIPAGQNINAQCYYYNPGIPRAILFYNNTLTLRTVPDTQYLVELEAYLSPAAFLSSGQAIQFAYMSEYIARGAARKILSDTGDSEQFAFYEPLFREQEMLVWKRSQRQFTSTRTYTIYSQGNNQGGIGNNTSTGLP
jgi:hypothetical protein